ncbi:MAG: iron-sulfur cluster assembly protein [Paludibacteraceae bacterium]|nr:iron-sulfur cluster assembly protein [Paludibacteraceae bacterium]
MNEFLALEEKIVTMLKTVYDPEIPVNVYDLGLIYNLDIDSEQNVTIDMTLTAPSCPMADFIVEDVEQKVASVEGIKKVKVNLVFEPEWDKSRMSEEAMLELGML